MRTRDALLFLLAAALASLFVFRDALWGQSLLAPLDIAPAMLSRYHDLVADAPAVPANHHIIDQLTYDLPQQWTAYQAWRRGEIPWWDPYTYAGRPLLADAHVSVTDPIRVGLNLLLPFLAAYNWTRILHFLLAGFGAFLLLRRWSVSLAPAILLALAFQFAGYFSIYFGHPWLHATFLYFPYLWLAWDYAAKTNPRRGTALAALLVAGVFFAGDIQSHIYLLLFLLAFTWGYWVDPAVGRRRLVVVLGASLLLGGCLALPVLAPSVELFRLSIRRIVVHSPLTWLSGVPVLASLYPWAFGTHVTLDLGRFVNCTGAGFVTYLGSAAWLLGVVALTRPVPAAWRVPRRVAVALLALYLVAVSTPLCDYLYVRSAGLAVLALVVLAATGLAVLADQEQAGRVIVAWGLAVVVGVVVVTHVFAFAVYPRLRPWVQRYVDQHAAQTAFGAEGQALRTAQVDRLPAEITWINPEPLLATLSVVALAAWAWSPAARRRPRWVAVILLLNLLPVLWYTQRYIPRQPRPLWERLRQGASAQQAAASQLADRPQRLLDRAPTEQERLFPYAFAHFYRVRTVHGYATLQPRCLYRLSPAAQENLTGQLADYVSAPATAADPPSLQPVGLPQLARFQWPGADPRPVAAEDRGLNRMRLRFPAGPAATLLWTDTCYPGWQARSGSRRLVLRPVPPTFTAIEVPADVTEVDLLYRPRGLAVAASVAALGLLAVVMLLATGRRSALGRDGLAQP